MRLGIIGLVSVGLASCTPSSNADDRARMAKLEARVTALEQIEQQTQSPTRPDARRLYELIGPADADNTRRLYASEAECTEAKQQILNDAANRLANEQANFPNRPMFGAPPAVSCIPV